MTHNNYDLGLFYLFDCIFPIIIITIGCIGNLFSFIVYSRKVFMKNSLGIYFCSLSITDTLTLFNILKYFLKYAFKIDIRLFDEFFCKAIEYFSLTISSISAWTLVIISFDRMVYILYPKIFILLNRRMYQVIIIVSNYLLNMVFYIAAIRNAEFIKFLPDNSNFTKNMDLNLEYINITIECKYDYRMHILRFIDLISSSLLPFLFMVVFSFFTIRSIAKSRKKMKTNKILNKTKKLISKDLQFALTSIFLNLVFLFLTSPVLIFHILDEFNLKSDAFTILYRGSDILFYINFSTLFFVSYFFNSIFKCEFLNIINSINKNKVKPAAQVT